MGRFIGVTPHMASQAFVFLHEFYLLLRKADLTHVEIYRGGRARGLLFCHTVQKV